MLSKKAKGPSLIRPIAAGLAAFAILLISVLSAAPQIHAALHAGSAENGQAQHSEACNPNDCPLAMFSAGITTAETLSAEIPTALLFHSVDVRSCSHKPSFERYLIPPGRAPPAAA